MTEEMIARRRLALQLAQQLPADPDEALEILAETRRLVRTFLMPRKARRKPAKLMLVR